MSWEALFIFDLMVFALTLGKTLSERYRIRVTSGRHDIIALILRDGTLRAHAVRHMHAADRGLTGRIHVFRVRPRRSGSLPRPPPTR